VIKEAEDTEGLNLATTEDESRRQRMIPMAHLRLRHFSCLLEASKAPVSAGVVRSSGDLREAERGEKRCRFSPRVYVAWITKLGSQGEGRTLSICWK